MDAATGSPAARFPQVRTLRSPDALRERLDELGLDLPVDDRVEPDGPLAQPLELLGRRLPNRFCILPMEGWDGTTDGRPTDLVRRRWRRFGAGGAAVIWAEATAVQPEGRANPNQLRIGHDTARDLAALRVEAVDAHRSAGHDPDGPLIGLQLTHSGRWARPDGTSRPRIAYRHPLLDRRVPVADDAVLTDAELDGLGEAFVAAAVLAAECGFDFVDVKSCHGYLLHELLSAHDRPGPYGGDLEGRSRFLRRVLREVRSAAPGLGLAVRLSAFDAVPHRAGADGRGEPEPVTGDGYGRAFGGDAGGHGIDLSETHALCEHLTGAGVSLLGVTAGSPYYCPHVQRPAWFPPSDGYDPPRDPLVDVARLVEVAGELAARHPSLTVVGAGWTYLQQWLAHVAQPVVARGSTALVGLGRMALSYPDLPADVLAGTPLDRRAICRTFSDCTTAPRNGLVSGCYPLDPFYKERPERVELARAKRASRTGATEA